MSRLCLFACALALAALGGAAGCAATQAEKGGLVALPVSQAELDRAHAARRLALVVGIGAFEDPGWRALRYADKDAADLAQALADRARGGFEVTAALGPAATSREGLRAQLAALRERNTSPDDVVLVYFSTHGSLARDARGALRRYLVARDTRLEAVRDTGLPLDELEATLEALPSRRKVLVLATCHSGAGKSLLPPEVLKELEGTKAGFFAPPLEEVSRASVVLAACDWGETAREDSSLANDIYTHFFVEALLRPADRNGDGAVTATEAHDYARRRTFEFTGGQQRPSALIREVGADPVVLAGRVLRVGQPELYGYEAALDGLSVSVDGAEPVLLPGAVAVPQGAHRVQIAKGDGSTLLDQDLRLGLGERLDLGDLLAHPEPRTAVTLAAGYGGFLGRDAAQIAGPAAGVQLAVERADLLARHLGLRADLSWAGGRQTLAAVPGEAPVPYQQTGVQLGLAAPYQLRLGRVTLELGPRLGAVYLARRFELSGYRERQSYLSVSPGLTGGLQLSLDRRWLLFARADLAAEAVRVDGVARLSGFGSAWAGVGFRP